MWRNKICIDKKFLFVFLLLLSFISASFLTKSKILFKSKASPKNSSLGSTLLRNSPNDLIADLILGHSDFGEVIPKETVPFKLAGPGGVAVDKSIKPYRVYVFDGQNSRILGYKHLGYCSTDSNRPCTGDSDCESVVGQGRPTKIGKCNIDLGKDGTKLPDLVIGQNSFYGKSSCNQDASFQSYPVKISSSGSTICSIRDDEHSYFEGGSTAHMFIDKAGNLYFPDSFNNRVLKYINPFETDTIADDVWGQLDYKSRSCNKDKNAPDESTLCLGINFAKSGVDIDNLGNLWIADVGNNRVLRFKNVNGVIQKAADLVLGQKDFFSNIAGNSLNNLNSPSAIRVDSKGRPIVLDSFNNRVLIYDSNATSGGNGRILQTGELPQSLLIVETKPEFNRIVVSYKDKIIIKDYNKEWKNVQNATAIIKNIIDSHGEIGSITENSFLIPVSGGSQNILYLRSIYDNGDFLYKKPDSFDNGEDNHNYIGMSGFRSLRGVTVTDSQVIVSDTNRLAFWNNINLNTLTKGKEYDGYFGNFEANLKFRHDSSSYMRIFADEKVLWAIVNNFNAADSNTIEQYHLPVKKNDRPFNIIKLNELLVEGKKVDKNFISIASDIYVDDKKGYIWLSLPFNDRVIRIKIPSSGNEYIVDLIIGGKDIPDIILPIWGRKCDANKDFPKTLCYPGSIAFDKNGDLYISEHYLENFGGGRLIKYSKDAISKESFTSIPISQMSENAEVIFYNFNGWKPSFNSKNVMVYGKNGLDGPDSRFLNFVNDISNQKGQKGINIYLNNNGQLKDFYAQPFSTYFDKNDNLYVTDLNRGSLYIYKKPF